MLAPEVEASGELDRTAVQPLLKPESPTPLPKAETFSVVITDSSSPAAPMFPAVNTVTFGEPPISGLRTPITVKPEVEVIAKRHLHISAGIDNTLYDQFEPRMRNGGTAVGLGADFPISPRLELQADLSFSHGFDQKLSAENTRMTTLRLDPLFSPAIKLIAPARLLIGLGLGYRDYIVRSYEYVGGSVLVMKQYAQGQSLVVFPEAGVHLQPSPECSLDLLAQQSIHLATGAEILNSTGAILRLGFLF